LTQRAEQHEQRDPEAEGEQQELQQEHHCKEKDDI
jgi:hypothetical protein